MDSLHSRHYNTAGKKQTGGLNKTNDGLVPLSDQEPACTIAGSPLRGMHQ